MSYFARVNTKQLTDRVLFEETETCAFLSFLHLVNESSQCLFHICAIEYPQHLELDKSFFISTGSVYIHFVVFCHSF